MITEDNGDIAAPRSSSLSGGGDRGRGGKSPVCGADISLSTRRYLSVLIRAVAGPP